MNKPSNGYFWGITLLAFGLLLLAKTMGWFQINWSHIMIFWPVLLIAAGLSLLLGRGQSWSGPVAALLIAVAIPSAIINKTHNRWNQFKDDVHIDFDDENNDENNNDDSENNTDEDYKSDRGNGSNGYFSENLPSNIKTAQLNFGAGAGSFKIEGTTSKLIEANTESELGGYILSTKSNDTQKNSVVDFKMESKDSTKIDFKNWDDVDNKVKIQLNAVPTWSMKLDVGAGKADFDLSDYKVQKIDLNAGVAKIDLKVGDKEPLTEIDINAGVASIDVEVPESSGCELITKGALNIKDVDGLEKINDNLYRSTNFDKASKKVKVVYEGGISSLKIRRY